MEKTIRTATLGIAEEFRRMEIGEVVQFPTAQYNYNSIRATPSTTLVNERLEGKKWRTKINFDDKCVEVTRLA